MNVAVISFDQDFINQVKRELPSVNIRGYIDSLSMLKELSDFNPSVIIYDASSGEFAIDDLKFLLTRDKVEKKKFRVLLSREQPVDIDSFPEVEDIIYYTKETDVSKLISDIKSEIEHPGKGAETSHIEEPEIKTDNLENFLETSPFEEEIPEPVSTEFTNNLGDFAISKEEEKEIKDTLEFLEGPLSKEKKDDVKEHTPSELEDFSFETVSYEENTQQKEDVKTPELSKGFLKLEIDISIEDIKKTIAEKAVDKLVKEVLKSPEMEELIDNIQRDFVERTEKELESIKEKLKDELKEKLISSIESELKESLIETIKEDVAKLTAQIVKEKLEQLFGGK